MIFIHLVCFNPLQPFSFFMLKVSQLRPVRVTACWLLGPFDMFLLVSLVANKWRLQKFLSLLPKYRSLSFQTQYSKPDFICSTSLHSVIANPRLIYSHSTLEGRFPIPTLFDISRIYLKTKGVSSINIAKGSSQD